MGLKINPKLLSRLIDILLLSGGIACFAVFGYFSVRGGYAPAGEAIAKLKSGNAERKRVGAVMFAEISAGDKLHHRDALWVGERRSARVEFNEGSVLALKERTFIVLERKMSGEQVITVLTGKAEMESAPNARIKIEEAPEQGEEDGDNNGTDEAPNADGPGPSPSPMASAAPHERGYHPQPNARIFLVKIKNEYEVTFGWPRKTPGTLVVTSDSKEVFQTAIGEELFIRRKLKIGSTYQWTILDQARKPIFGPLEFQLLPFDINKINVGAGANPDEPIEIIQ